MTSEHGTYRLSYTPPESTGYEEYPNIAIEMSTEGDASVDQMLRFYEAFLAAAGYILKGDLQIVELEETPSQSPCNFVTIAGGESSDYIPFGFGGNSVIYGSAGTDTISFGAARPAMEFGAKTWDDVISFG
jgi:hypothetical protein